jgi:hypothetical protein
VDGALEINRITPYVRTSAVHGGVDWARAPSVEEHDRVSGVRGDDVGEAPGERVHALLALVHGHHDAALGSCCRSGRRCHFASESRDEFQEEWR